MRRSPRRSGRRSPPFPKANTGYPYEAEKRTFAAEGIVKIKNNSCPGTQRNCTCDMHSDQDRTRIGVHLPEDSTYHTAGSYCNPAQKEGIQRETSFALPRLPRHPFSLFHVLFSPSARSNSVKHGKQPSSRHLVADYKSSLMCCQQIFYVFVCLHKSFLYGTR